MSSPSFTDLINQLSQAYQQAVQERDAAVLQKSRRLESEPPQPQDVGCAELVVSTAHCTSG